MLKFCWVSFRESATCMLSTTRPRFAVAKSRVRRKTLGRGGSSRERGLSGPKNMTVGCVILTAPRRKSVNHAVIADTHRANTEIVNELASAIFQHPLPMGRALNYRRYDV